MENFSRQRVDVAKIPSQVIEKWSPSVLNEGFVPFPKKLLRALHCVFPDNDSMKELAVILAVVDFKRPNLSRSPSLEYLAFLAGLEENEFKEALGRLEQKTYAGISGDSKGLEISLDGFLKKIETETQE
jgi:hypothetical protein